LLFVIWNFDFDLKFACPAEHDSQRDGQTGIFRIWNFILKKKSSTKWQTISITFYLNNYFLEAAFLAGAFDGVSVSNF
jgi:hypothetical protein